MTANETISVEPHPAKTYPVWLQVLVIHVIGLAVGYLLYPLNFGTNDDSAMALIWQGTVNGVPADQPRLIFISTFIGEFLKLGLEAFPDFDSYSAFQQACVLVSSLVISWIMLTLRRDTFGTLVVLAFVLFYPSYFLRNIQFTQTSIILISAGACIAFYACLVAKRHWLLWLPAFGFMVLGGLIRHFNLNLIVLVMVMLITAIIVSYGVGEAYRFRSKKQFLMRVVLAAVTGFAAVATVSHLKHLENEQYYASDGWQDFYAVQGVRSAVQHNVPPGYSRIVLNSVASYRTEFSLNDVELLRSWMIADDNMESAKSLRAINAVFNDLKTRDLSLIDQIESRAFKDWLKRSPEVVFSIFIIPLAGFVLAIPLAFGGQFRRAFFLVASSVAWSTGFVVIVLTLALYFRYPPPRVYVPLAGLMFVLASVNALYLAGRFLPSVSMPRMWWVEAGNVQGRYSAGASKINAFWNAYGALILSVSSSIGLIFILALPIPPHRHGLIIVLIGILAWAIKRLWDIQRDGELQQRGIAFVENTRGFVVKKGWEVLEVPRLNPLYISASLAGLVIVSMSVFAPLTMAKRTSVSYDFFEKRCMRSEQFLNLAQNTRDKKLLIMPGMVHSPCFVRPYAIKFPALLTERAVLFGWMGYTPWLRQRLFAENTSIPQILCREERVALYGRETDGQLLNMYISERGGLPDDMKINREIVDMDGNVIERYTCVKSIG